jgi:hypothetical protein
MKVKHTLFIETKPSYITCSDKGASASMLWEVTFSAIRGPFVSSIILQANKELLKE